MVRLSHSFFVNENRTQGLTLAQPFPNLTGTTRFADRTGINAASRSGVTNDPRKRLHP